MIFVLNLWLMIQRIVRHRRTGLPSWYDTAEFLMLKTVVRTVTTLFSRAEEFLIFEFWKWCQVKEIKLSAASYWVVPLRLASLALRGNYVLSGILVSAESHRNVMLPSEWIGAHRTARATARKQTPPPPTRQYSAVWRPVVVPSTQKCTWICFALGRWHDFCSFYQT